MFFLSGQSTQINLPIDVNKGKEICIIFVHGFSESHKCWNDIVKKIGDNAHCVAYDCLGHGENTALWPQVSFENYVKQLSDVIDQVKAGNENKRVILAGHSQGANIVAQYAVSNPDKIDGLMPISSFVNIQEPLHALWSAYLGLVKSNQSNAIEQFWDINSSLLLGTQSSSWSQFRPDAIQHRVDFFQKDHLIRLISTLLDTSVKGGFELLKDMPVHLVHGQRDLMFPLDGAKALKAAHPSFELTKVKGANHLLVELDVAGAVSQSLINMAQKVAGHQLPPHAGHHAQAADRPPTPVFGS